MLHYANASTARCYPQQGWVADAIRFQEAKERMSGDGSLGNDVGGPTPGGPSNGDSDGSGTAPSKYNPYTTCSDAEAIQMPNGGYVVINPYLLPYSESDCMDSYADSSIPAFDVQSMNAPDHVVMTN